MIVCIDPGNYSAGVAVFAPDSHALLLASVAQSKDGDPLEIADGVRQRLAMLGGTFDGCTLVVERPMKYPGHAAPERDLVTLSVCAGVIVGALRDLDPRVEWLTAPEWKGGTPKPAKGAPYIIATRARGILTPHELARVSAPKGPGALDVWDATGMGLYYTERATRGLRHGRVLH